MNWFLKDTEQVAVLECAQFLVLLDLVQKRVRLCQRRNDAFLALEHRPQELHFLLLLLRLGKLLWRLFDFLMGPLAFPFRLRLRLRLRLRCRLGSRAPRAKLLHLQNRLVVQIHVYGLIRNVIIISVENQEIGSLQHM